MAVQGWGREGTGVIDPSPLPVAAFTTVERDSFFFFNVYLFILTERKREDHKQTLSSAEPDAGLYPTNCEIMT